MRHAAWIITVIALATRGSESAIAADPPLVPIGVAAVDITPQRPVHLINQLEPRESTQAGQKLWARAIAIGGDSSGVGPGVWIVLDAVGVPRAAADAIIEKIILRHHLPRQNIVICATHTHCAPHLSDLLPTIFGEPLPADHQNRVDAYTRQMIDRAAQAADLAMANRRPRRLAFTAGELDLAVNRRTVRDGRFVSAADNPDGPVDRNLPMLIVRERDGRLRAIVLNYACHNTAITARDFSNRMHGDWIGSACAALQRRHEGVTAIFTMGCGGDARPNRRGDPSVADAIGEAVADQVDRMLAEPSTPIAAAPRCVRVDFDLPLESPPSRDELQQIVGSTLPNASRNARARAHLAGAMLRDIDNGVQPASELPYAITTWRFGDDLTMVFLAGEVVIDYALRLKRELRDERLWVTAYANAQPCYIPSARVLAEGGYEAEQSLHYYGRLQRLRPEAENAIINAVREALRR